MEILIAVIAGLAGLIVGALLGSRLGLRGEQTRRKEAERRLVDLQADLAAQESRVLELERANSALETRLDERQRTVEAEQELTVKMREAFQALSQEVLSRNSEDFLRLAQQRFESLKQEADGALQSRQEAVKNLVDPLTEKLEHYGRAVKELEEKRQTAYSTLEERLRMMVEAERGLQQETNRLVTALRAPQVRGRWGEMSLRNAVELAGMSEYCDFTEQEAVSVESGTQRPDMVVRLPGSKSIVVDAKVPLDAYLDAIECQDLEGRERHMLDHARQCGRHLDTLARKAYWDQFSEAPDCVVMFIPGESLFAAAVEADKTLLARGLENKVIIATPATFIAMLYAVHYGWQQQTFAENALAVQQLASELHDRLRVFAEHLGKLGTSLTRSVGAYNDAVGSLEGRVLVSARKLKEMGTTGKEDIPRLPAVDITARLLSPELAATEVDTGQTSEGDDIV